MNGVRQLMHGPTRTLLVAGIIISLALAVAFQWRAIEAVDWSLSWPPFLGALALFSLGPLAGGCAFWLLLRTLVPNAPLLPSLWVWERSFAARYVPSGALTVAVRIIEGGRLGASRSQMLSASAFEQLVAVGAAAAVSLAAFATAGRKPPLCCSARTQRRGRSRLRGATSRARVEPLAWRHRPRCRGSHPLACARGAADALRVQLVCRRRGRLAVHRGPFGKSGTRILLPSRRLHVRLDDRIRRAARTERVGRPRGHADRAAWAGARSRRRDRSIDRHPSG